jgi:hypothetical protein
MKAKPRLICRSGLLAALVAAVAAAYGQAERPGAALASPMTEARVEPSGALNPGSPPRLEQAAARPRSDVDARHCLDFASNAEVHRCAERYRTRAMQAKGKPAPN